MDKTSTGSCWMAQRKGIICPAVGEVNDDVKYVWSLTFET